ncbi:MAG: hypothetical protein H8E98_07705 [Bacteroidetes bacterium]|nr:hypothetical protein [Bacteroidota bacterium]
MTNRNYTIIIVVLSFLTFGITSFNFYADCTKFDCLKVYEPAEQSETINQTGACIYVDPILEDEIVGAIQNCEGGGELWCNKQRCRWWKSCCKNGDLPPPY